jgi:glycosyltransferase involved in cell wall biosynthesis
MKIAMLSSWQEPCGIADYTAALVRALSRRVEVRVVPLKHGQTDPAYFRRLGEACNQSDLIHVQHEYVFFGNRWPWGYRWPEMVKAFRVPFVVTAHTRLQAAQGGPEWKRWGRSLRDAVVRASGWSQYLEAGQFLPARKIITHTAAHREFLIQRGISGDRVQVMPQGIPDKFPKGQAARARQQWNLKGPVVTLFGFLNPAKGHALALQAWDSLLSNATLVIAGKAFSSRDEAYAQHIQTLAQQKGNRVRWLGYLEETALSDLLAATDVVLMPYTSATSSYALSLALANGCAVLASDLEPFREIQSEKKCLALFKQNDPNDLAKTLNFFLKTAEAVKNMRQSALSWAREHGWEGVAKKTVALYERVLKEKGNLLDKAKRF